MEKRSLIIRSYGEKLVVCSTSHFGGFTTDTEGNTIYVEKESVTKEGSDLSIIEISPYGRIDLQVNGSSRVMKIVFLPRGS